MPKSANLLSVAICNLVLLVDNIGSRSSPSSLKKNFFFFKVYVRKKKVQKFFLSLRKKKVQTNIFFLSLRKKSANKFF